MKISYLYVDYGYERESYASFRFDHDAICMTGKSYDNGWIRLGFIRDDYRMFLNNKGRVVLLNRDYDLETTMIDGEALVVLRHRLTGENYLIDDNGTIIKSIGRISFKKHIYTCYMDFVNDNKYKIQVLKESEEVNICCYNQELFIISNVEPESFLSVGETIQGIGPIKHIWSVENEVFVCL